MDNKIEELVRYAEDNRLTGSSPKLREKAHELYGDRVLGIGSGRVVIKHGVDQVLKIAVHTYGLYANEDEHEVYWRDKNLKHTHQFKHLCPVIDHDPNDRWLVMQKAEPLSKDDIPKYKDEATEIINYFISEGYTLDDHDFVADADAVRNWGILEDKLVIVDYGDFLEGGM